VSLEYAIDLPDARDTTRAAIAESASAPGVELLSGQYTRNDQISGVVALMINSPTARRDKIKSRTDTLARVRTRETRLALRESVRMAIIGKNATRKKGSPISSGRRRSIGAKVRARKRARRDKPMSRLSLAFLSSKIDPIVATKKHRFTATQARKPIEPMDDIRVTSIR
jgi:hypothetical protein